MKRRLRLGPLTRADELTWDLEHTYEDRPWRNWIFRRLPDNFQVPAAERYRATWETKGYREANIELRELSERLKCITLPIAARDEDIICFAKRRALECVRTVSSRQDSTTQLQAVLSIAELQGVTAPSVRGITPRGIIARLCSDLWWRRAVRKYIVRSIEIFAIKMGFVHGRAGLYVSDEALTRRREQKLRNRRTLAAVNAENELGDSFTLEELADKSVSNPTNRRAELMVRMRGFEELATENGHIGVFLTFTVPSRFHARYEDGSPNSNYGDLTPRDAQAWLTNSWKLIRSALLRNEIRPYGFRITEPHHDGTPHWHLLLFLPSEQQSQLDRICRHYLFADSGNEPGALEHRYELVEIDPKKGSATGYIAKYIYKNVDGHGVGEDLEDPEYRPISETVDRVEAWATTWGIRQFQQIGGPPVTVWRELRRIKIFKPGLIGDAARCSDASDWAGYVRLCGGATVRKDKNAIRLDKAWSDKPNRYGEPKGWIIVGVVAGNERLSTRVHTWTIRYGIQIIPATQQHPSSNSTVIRISDYLSRISVDKPRNEIDFTQRSMS